MVTAAGVVGIVRNVISFFLLLSPLPTIVSVCKNRSVQQFSSTPYLATYVNCVVGVLYALPWVKPDNMPLITVNALGAAIELVYIVIFFVFATERKQRILIILVVVTDIIFMNILSSITFTVLHTPAKRTEVVGNIGVIFSICMYASPLSVVKTVIQNMSVEYMPFSISLASFLNCVAWTTYAGLCFELFLLIPNGIGAVLSFLQLILYGIYYKSTHRQLAARNAQGRGEIVMGNDDNARTIPA